MPFEYTNSKSQKYYLFSKTVKLRGGDRMQTIFYFTRKKDADGKAVNEIPDGFQVKESERTGLPFLKRSA